MTTKMIQTSFWNPCVCSDNARCAATSNYKPLTP